MLTELLRVSVQNLLLQQLQLALLSQKSLLLSDIAKSTLDTEGAARALGISFEKLFALQRSVQDFRIDPQQLTGILQTVNELIIDAENGFGKLRQIANEAGFELTSSDNAESIFNKILQAYGKIENEQIRIRAFSELFGKDLGAQLSTLSQNFSVYQKSVNDFSQTAKDTKDTIAVLQAYEKSINKLSSSFDGLKTVIVISLGYLVERLTFIIDELGQAFEKVSGNSFVSFLKKQHEFAVKIDDVILDLASKTKNALLGPSSSSAIATPVQVTNNNTFNMSPGSTQDDANFISQTVVDETEEAFRNRSIFLESNFNEFE